MTAPHARPRTRQRIQKEPPPLDVPDINDDAAERKRVLNVLAQRRYRERKRQTRKAGSSQGGDQAPSRGVALNRPEESAEEVDEAAQVPALPFLSDVSLMDIGIDLDGNSDWEALLGDHLPVTSFLANPPIPALPTAPTGDSPSYSLSHSSSTITSINPTTLLSSHPSDSDASSSSSFSFPDSYLLPVSELTLLRAFLRIAARLNVARDVWDLAALSPFSNPDPAPTAAGPGSTPDALPPAWQPTPAQLLVTHHPLLDLLPWPVARERVIRTFGLPARARPPVAAGPLALVEFAYDLEDGAEGLRVWGGDPCDPAAWEVGQKVFERWWFIFDREIVEQSNRWREARGAARLTLGGGGDRVDCGLLAGRDRGWITNVRMP